MGGGWGKHLRLAQGCHRLKLCGTSRLLPPHEQWAVRLVAPAWLFEVQPVVFRTRTMSLPCAVFHNSAMGSRTELGSQGTTERGVCPAVTVRGQTRGLNSLHLFKLVHVTSHSPFMSAPHWALSIARTCWPTRPHVTDSTTARGLTGRISIQLSSSPTSHGQEASMTITMGC